MHTISTFQNKTFTEPSVCLTSEANEIFGQKIQIEVSEICKGSEGSCKHEPMD